MRFSGTIAESVTLAQEVRTFNVGEELMSDVDGQIVESSNLSFRTRLLAQMMPTLYQNIAIALVLVGMAGVDLFGGGGVAALGAVVLILIRALSYSQQLQTNYHSLVETGPYLDELQERQALYTASAPQSGSREIAHIGRLRFEDVSFAYVPGVPVLHDLSFEVGPGDSVGIVGPSGSGKSTLVQLLLRLRHPDGGRFLVDGEDVDEVSFESWYRRVAFVPQEPRLLRGSVADNIRFLRPHLDQSDVEQAAEAGSPPRRAWSAGPRATTPRSASAAGRCRAGSASASCSLGRWPRNPTSSSSTSPPAPST